MVAGECHPRCGHPLGHPVAPVGAPPDNGKVEANLSGRGVMAPALLPPPGTDVLAGRFELGDPIASGGSGVVWRAWDNRLDRPCAAKLLRRRDAGELLRFAREQSVRLSHAHVLTPYTWAAEDDYVLIASELVEGGSLAGLVGDYGPLAEPTVAALLLQLLDALAHVHECGLIHRDVKPANILLRATGTGPLHVLLADFGLALRPDDARLTEHGMVIGTPGYLPPEVLRDTSVPAPAHDLYALGRLAGALLTAVEPDPGGDAADLSTVHDTVLRRAVEAFSAPELRVRPRSAEQARDLLRGAAVDPRPRSAEGELIDIVNQLPALGWMRPLPDGPTNSSVPRRAVESGTAIVAERHPVRARIGVLVPAAVVVAAVGAVLAIALTAGTDKPGTGPFGTSTPTTTAPGRGTAGLNTPPTGVVATGPVVAPGDPCTWQQQNDKVASAGRTVTCTLADGRYHWSG